MGVIETGELGDQSHVVYDGAVAVVVDPRCDVDRVERVFIERGLRCASVVETHIHNDYVTGGLELARRAGAPYLVAAADDVRSGCGVRRRRAQSRRSAGAGTAWRHLPAGDSRSGIPGGACVLLL